MATHVYVIRVIFRCDGCGRILDADYGGTVVKIGMSDNPSARLTSLQGGNHMELGLWFSHEFANAAEVERHLHERFADRRLRGEWFHLDHDQLAALAVELLITPTTQTREDHHAEAEDEGRHDPVPPVDPSYSPPASDGPPERPHPQRTSRFPGHAVRCPAGALRVAQQENGDRWLIAEMAGLHDDSPIDLS